MLFLTGLFILLNAQAVEVGQKASGLKRYSSHTKENVELVLNRPGRRLTGEVGNRVWRYSGHDSLRSNRYHEGWF